MDQALRENLLDWLRIPSISTGGGDPADRERAAEWVCARVRAAGGEAALERIGDGNPLAVGELRAADPDAPTVLIYGHYDVQGIGDPDAWESPPFEPTQRGERRGWQGELQFDLFRHGLTLPQSPNTWRHKAMTGRRAASASSSGTRDCRSLRRWRCCRRRPATARSTTPGVPATAGGSGRRWSGRSPSGRLARPT